MGNCIDIFDKDGNLIGHSTHGMACGFYVNDIVKKYNPDYNMFSAKDINEQLEPAFSNGTPEDLIILHLFMNDESTFDESDLPNFEKAIEVLESDNRIHETIRTHLEAYMKLLKEIKFFKTKYAGAFAAIAVSKG